MLLISKRYLWFFSAFLGLLWIGYSVAGFFVDSETLLFLGILGFFLLTGLVIGGVVAGFTVLKKAKRLLGASPDSPEATRQWKTAMGDLGTSILSHERRLIEGNWSLTHKIQGMNRLVGFLVRNFPEPVFVTDILGKIVYVSPKGAGIAESTTRALVGVEIRKVFPEFRLFTVLSDLERSTGQTHFISDKKKIGVYGLSSRKRTLVYLLFVRGSEVVEPMEEEFSDTDSLLVPGTGSQNSLFGRLRQSVGRVFGSRKE